MTEQTFTTISRPVQPILKKEEGGKFDDSEKEILLLNYSIEIAKFIDDEKEARV